MEPSLGSLPTTEASASQPRPRAHRARIGRRVLALFILSALLPLSLCAAILYKHFSTGLQVAHQRSLDELARGYGMTLLGRLESADETLRLIVSDPATTDVLAKAQARKLPWVKTLQLVAPSQKSSANASPVPAPDPRQSLSLRRGESVLISGLEASPPPTLYLARRLPSGALLYVAIDPRSIWSDAADYSGEATLLVLDGRGRPLTSTSGIPATFSAAGPDALSTPRTTAAGYATKRNSGLSDDWTVRSWELFLGSRFTAPSWTVVALEKRPSILGESRDVYLPIFAFIVLTILLIAWLSMTSIRRQLRPLELLIRATRQLSQRDFEAFRNLHWNDEFGDLARSFDTMSAKLQRQFAALETFSDVDRLLLSDPELESILDEILPQVAAILSCERVSVLLFDPDSSANASVYEYCVSRAERLPMRRISQDAARAIVAPGPPPGRIEVHPLRHGQDCTGLLCLAYTDAASTDPDHGVDAKDFADRLSLIIASLRRSDQLRRQANFDSLTGLQNRQRLAACVAEAVAAAAQRGGVGSLMYIDLDHFKRVNDTSGHAAGDRLLKVVSERLTGSVAAEASIARLGGDEFAVLLPSITSRESALQTAARIIARLEPPIEVDNRPHQISASIGITLFPSDGSTLEELMRVGDIAMYHAKAKGRGKAEFYRREMQHDLLERMRVEEGLKRAFQNRELVLHYQPIVSQDDATLFAVEALARWPTEGGTAWIAPSVFIPLAEENGLIVQLGQWVLESTCEQFARWRESGLRVSYASVNVSVRQLTEPHYLDNLLRTLRKSGMCGGELQIEITESVLAQEAAVEGILGQIAAQGVRIALDDFGTGYSSLSYLRRLPIDTVKIDRSFIMGVPQDRDASRLVESVILMCAAVGKKVVAEGIETDDQRQYLIQAGCTTLQGYLFGRPMDAADIPGFARRLRSLLHPTGVGDEAVSSTPGSRVVNQR